MLKLTSHAHFEELLLGKHEPVLQVHRAVVRVEQLEHQSLICLLLKLLQIRSVLLILPRVLGLWHQASHEVSSLAGRGHRLLSKGMQVLLGICFLRATKYKLDPLNWKAMVTFWRQPRGIFGWRQSSRSSSCLRGPSRRRTWTECSRGSSWGLRRWCPRCFHLTWWQGLEEVKIRIYRLTISFGLDWDKSKAANCLHLRLVVELGVIGHHRRGLLRD